MINFNKLLNEEFEETARKLSARGVEKDLLLETKKLIIKKKEAIFHLNSLRSKKNEISKEVNSFSKDDAILLKEQIKNQEIILNNVNDQLKVIIDYLPNILSDDFCEKDLIKKEKIFETEIKSDLNYEKIIEKTDFVNFKDAAKISGSKFVIYNEEATKILHSLINFMLSENKKNGYKLISAPYLVNINSLYNSGQFPKFSEDIFKIENTKYALIPTSEVTLVNIYSDKIIEESKLPIKVSTYSACFREEAGSAGKENKNIIRLHQFNKVELVKITRPEESYKELELLLNDVCSILEKLEISYRVVMLSAKELGISSAKTYDVEIWLPNSKRWIEISSCSNCEDFQSNRSKIRSIINNKKVILHTLNGSSLAIDRLMAAILEYYYNSEENKVEIPKAISRFYEIY